MTHGFGAFFQAYVECALWSTIDDDGSPLDQGGRDLAPEAMEQLRQGAESFYNAHSQLFSEVDDAQAGHDFWLTRNGHGAGFWDGDWPDNGVKLTEASVACGTVDLYVGDDGKVYVHG